MKFIAKFLVAALLLTGSAAGILAPTVNPAPAATPSAVTAAAEMPAELTAPEAIGELAKAYEPPKTTPTQPSAKELTTAEAFAIALADADLTAEEVTNTRSRQETDDGVLEWELEFRCGDYEYDYTIHAHTGKILEWDKDYDPPKPAPTELPTMEATKLTKEEALAIALKHAGLTADEITRVQCQYDVDDGVPQWEVEFRVGRMEYEYTIHAETGEILEWDKENDD